MNQNFKASKQWRTSPRRILSYNGISKDNDRGTNDIHWNWADLHEAKNKYLKSAFCITISIRRVRKWEKKKKEKWENEEIKQEFLEPSLRKFSCLLCPRMLWEMVWGGCRVLSETILNSLPVLHLTGQILTFVSLSFPLC